MTIDSGAVCRSISAANYANILTHNAGVTLTIGDGTAGGLVFSAGMTYTLDNATTSAISFISTSATVQAVNFAGKTTGNVTYNASSNGSWQMTGTHNTGTTATVTLTQGTLDTNGQTASWGKFITNSTLTRTLTLGASAITMTGTGTVWDFGTGTNLTFNANTSTVTISGAAAVFSGGARTYNSVVFNGSGIQVLTEAESGFITFGNLTRTGTAAKTDGWQFNVSFTVTGTLTITGNSTTNRLLVVQNVIGTARTVTVNGTVTASNVDFRDITGAGSASWNLSAITGGSGDAGGNSGITFTTAADQHWVSALGGNWSDATKWTSRVPLPQDDVFFDNAFTAAQTVTADMPRLGKSIDWTGATGSPTFNTNNTANTIYGSLTFISGMNHVTGFGTVFEGRGAFTLTSAGRSFLSLTMSMFNGTLTLQDAYTGTSTFTLNNGTLNANDFNLTTNVFRSDNANVRAITMGSGTWTFPSTGTVWNTATTTNLTLNSGTSTIAITNTSATSKTFAGGGLMYNNFSITGGDTGAVIIQGSNTFNVFTINAPKTVTFTSGTTQTVSSFVAVGSVGNVITINSSTPGSAATLSKSSGVVSADWLSLQDSAATGGASWFAGANSTNVSNNTGWVFTPPPAGGNKKPQPLAIVKQTIPEWALE